MPGHRHPRGVGAPRVHAARSAAVGVVVTGRRPLLAVLLTVIAMMACSGQSTRSRPLPPPPISSSSPTTASTPPAGAGQTVWLCRPGHQPDPCVSDLTTTYLLGDGSRRQIKDPGTRANRADCFYAYPTISNESQKNADLRIRRVQRQVAFAQVSRFSAVCDVWSPVYRQRTVGDLINPIDGKPDSVANRTAYESLRDGWRSFLATHDPSRPIVLIGHSQGASMLIRLLRNDIDNDPAVRRHIALALLLGGNLAVATGKTTGGDLQHIPLCTRRGQACCVIAYSTFPEQPPPAAFFGRPGQGVSLLSGNPRRVGLQVACVNPARPGSTSALGLHPYFPSVLAKSGASTPWTAYPGHATAQCRTAGGATWLEVSPTPAARRTAELLRERFGSLWGFHDVDVNLTLGDLVAHVAASVARWHHDN